MIGCLHLKYYLEPVSEYFVLLFGHLHYIHGLTEREKRNMNKYYKNRADISLEIFKKSHMIKKLFYQYKFKVCLESNQIFSHETKLKDLQCTGYKAL